MKDGTITLSFFVIFPAKRDACRAEVPELNNKQYFLFLWHGVRKGNGLKFDGKGPIIVPYDYIKQFIPINTHSNGKWWECRIELELSKLNKIEIN